MSLTPEERKLRAELAAHESWAKTSDRTARTAAARRKFAESFESVVDPDGVLPPAERALRAESARRAHYKRMAFNSAVTRRRNAEARKRGGS